MADKKISELTAITAPDKIDTGDFFAIGDTTANGEAKRVTPAQVLAAVGLLNPNVANESYSGLTIEGTAGEAVEMGDICYLKSDGKYWQTDADSATTMPAVVMAAKDLDADASGIFLKYGYFRDDSIWGSLTVGALLYASTSPGSITHTAPTGSGDQVQVVGYAYSATNHTVFFNPNYLLIEVP